MLKSKRILLVIVAHCDYEIWQIDVASVFCQGNLGKDVYTTQPRVFSPTVGNKVYKLQRSIYGMKQASKSLKIRFNETIKVFGLSQNADEACVYSKVSGSAVVFLELYVDDRLIIGSDVSMLLSINVYWLSKIFSMKDLGEETYHSGYRSIEIDQEGCFIFHSVHI